ncbi:Two-component hybrid sensor and regulator [Caballeronia glathei]|uniref:histidine kinase n=1 Tax=Caballeronia glathei TaxID=60547 RepID=A0A069PT14_9BURK|nr:MULTISPECIES: response regulator [Burkholderiaceae]KDR43004.1 histidine kinase [Caballeronia glathei]TCK39232.1 PAS domain S-box-containing protein [Paraburkholderia sp. BL8N3]CDY75334.1 Two-component hybrid sensor and regulator [Caballeronia glathei]
MPFLTEDHGCPGWKGEMAGRIEAFDWSETELGPIGAWTRSLASTVRLMLASPVPLVMLWGRQGYMVYNDAYAAFAGGRHPYLLGSPVELGWPEVASFNRHVMDTCLGGGTLTYREKKLVLLRNGRPEAVWMDLYYSPVAGDDGKPAGVLAVVVETTERVLSERKREAAEAAYRATNERLQLALNTGAVLGTWVWDLATDTLRGDERFARSFSVDAEEAARGLPRAVVNRSLHPDDRARIERLAREAIESGEPFNAEYRIRLPDGSYGWVQANGRCQNDAAGVPYRFPGVLIDIHERKIAEEALLQLTGTLEQRVADAVAARAAAEAQLRQAQKMEAIGSLTGGVAHDFNNVLQVISGNLQMLATSAGNDVATQRRIASATDAVQRGARLAAQLLAFARRQPLSPAVVNPRRLLEGMQELLHRVLGETVAVHTHVDAGPWNVLVDRNQLENALLNLAINARDAMHGEGTLTLTASNVIVEAEPARETSELARGEYLCLSVSDTGVGMPPEVLEHAFEPFFTTKPDGRGTGLGLSMVFGFVKQSGGHTVIASELGQGTTVRLYFPRCREQEAPETGDTAGAPVGGQETILVVEDDADVRLAAVEMLAELGYKILKAPDGDAALRLIESGLTIDLLFTDVVMPGEVKSAELARRAAACSPPIPVLFTSGYTRDVIFHQGKLDRGVSLLSKPYRRDDLARKIRAALDASRGRQAVAAAPREARCAPGERSVLLVEDDTDSREAMHDLLTILGLACTAVPSAELALPLVAERRYDIVLSDVTLPGMSGADLARRVRDLQPDTRVLLVSGYGDKAEIGEPIPGVRVLAKPIDLSILQKELADLADQA